MKIIERIRDIRIFRSFWWRVFYYEQISSRISPRQKWLTQKVPRTWVDKDTLFEICILEGIKHYVEGEKCFQTLAWGKSAPPQQRQFLKEVRKNYNLITKTLPALEKQLKEEWNKVPPTSLDDINKGTKEDYKRIYGKIESLDKRIYNLKTRIMLWAVKERAGLWT